MSQSPIKKRKFYFLIAALISVLQFAFAGHAGAIQGGTDAAGDPRVVALIFGSNTRASCSGVPISPYVVVAAAHCLSNPNFTYSSETYQPNGLYVSQPGADLTRDNVGSRPRVIQVALTPGFNDKSFTNDLAFYFLDSPLVGAKNLPIANLDELKYLKDEGLIVTHLGYGYILGGNIEDFKPHKIELKAATLSSIRFGYLIPEEAVTVSTDELAGRALCKHDSGGPFLASISNDEKLFAINLSADGCDRYGVGTALKGTFGLSVYPYLSLLERQWKAFLDSHKNLPGISDADSILMTKIASAKIAIVPKKEAAASPSPSPSPSSSVLVTPTQSPSVKAQPIQRFKCVKGKSVKIYSEVTPRCPSGFKLSK